MSSYNNIQKIKYTKTPTDADVVSLHEYIMFEDTRAKEKFVVFKFSNNVNQRLFEFKFEVLQYNKDNELIEKSVVNHNNYDADDNNEKFIAAANDLFVPNAKLKINFECQSLEVNVEEAAFDRAIWSNGEFQDNSYRFESYAENISKQGNTNVSDSKNQPKDKEKKKKKNKKQHKLGFNIRNIFRRNRAAFPVVFNVILCIVFAALVVLSTFYFKQVTGAFVVDGFVVKESSGYVTIVNYSGNEENVEIPSTLGEKYTVTKIADGAFKKSSIKSIIISTQRELTIETGAFTNCSNLVTVVGADCGTVIVMESAFTNCKKLISFEVETARLGKKCFDGTNAIQTLIFNSVLFSDDNARLLDIFNGLDSINMNYTIRESYPDEFFTGIN